VNEQLFAQLSAWLAREPVALASVLSTRGATPRKSGSRMLITAKATHGSVGGGLTEARVIAAAHQLLRSGQAKTSLAIDLAGGVGAAGVCGGHMLIGLRRWHGEDDQQRAADIVAQLAAGGSLVLSSDDLGGEPAQPIYPDVRLVIIGAGHCGLALHDFARRLDFDLWVYDERHAEVARFKDATQLTGAATELARALDTPRTVFAVCLNRDFHTDIRVLRELAQRPPHFIGVMGSARRLHEVRRALPDCEGLFERLHAPVGIEIDAQTPHEIAVSILAQLIEVRRALITQEDPNPP